MVWIFFPQVKNLPNPRKPPNSCFRRRLEQLARQESRREHQEASVHALEAGAPLEAVLTAITHSPSTVFFAISLQNEFLMPSRSRRKNLIEV
jgi:hypothetical protein